MLSFGELAVYFTEQATVMPVLLRAEHEHNARTVAAEAAEYIGHEIPEWPALAAPTVKDKTDHGYTGRISATDPLLRTGAMQKSIEGAADFDGFTIGSNDPKAKFHELGTSRMPPRPFMALALSRNREHVEDRYGLLAMRALVPPATGRRV